MCRQNLNLRDCSGKLKDIQLKKYFYLVFVFFPFLLESFPFSPLPLLLRLTLHPSLIFSGPHTLRDLCHLGLKWSFSTLAAGRFLLLLFLWQQECGFCAEFNPKSASLLGRSRGLCNAPCFTLLNICSGCAAVPGFHFSPLSIHSYLSVTHMLKSAQIMANRAEK